MSHEIRTPLTAIVGFSEILEEEICDVCRGTYVSESLTSIKAAGRHLCEIIDDILDLSKIEAGRVALEWIDANPASLVKEVVRTLAPRAESRGLALMVDLSPDFSQSITTDPTRLRQILMNLVGNALKFTKHGGVRIAGTVAARGSRQWLQIDVVDTGCGMTAEQTARLFQSFSQADSTTTREYGGTGLGLVISRKLARLLGGEIVLLKSVPGAGSTFRCEVPLVNSPPRSVAESQDAGEAMPPRETARPGTLGGRVLLAEDSPDSRRLVSYLLRKAGASVDTADNGQLALDAWRLSLQRGEPYDLIVTDMQMPVVDGFSMVRTIRSEGDDIPIVALTAFAMKQDEVRCLSAGCDAYVTKPIDRAQFLQACQKVRQPRSAPV